MSRKHVLTAILATSLLMVLAVGASAQTPLSNPTTVLFTVSADHATIDTYVMGFFQTGATMPTQQAVLGKGTPNAQNEVQFPVPAYPIGVTYTARVKAVQGAAESEWSNETVPFVRTPAAPSGLVVR